MPPLPESSPLQASPRKRNNHVAVIKGRLIHWPAVYRLMREHFATDLSDRELAYTIHRSTYNGQLYVVTSGRTVAGSVCFNYDDTGKFWLNYIVVNPHFQKQGHGTRLMNTVEDYCRQHGIEKIHLAVIKDNHPAIELYRKFGFVDNGESGHKKLMVKSLPTPDKSTNPLSAQTLTAPFLYRAISRLIFTGIRLHQRTP